MTDLYTPFIDGETPAHTAINLRLAELDSAISALLGGFVAGSILSYSNNTPPSGWLVCDGSAVSRATYAALFAVIGTTFGSGDGSSTFNVPDMRGRTGIGAGTGSGLTARTLGQTLGEETHQLTVPELAAHSHTGTSFAKSAANWAAGANNGMSTDIATGSTGSDTAHNNMQPSLVVQFIIRT